MSFLELIPARLLHFLIVSPIKDGIPANAAIERCLLLFPGICISSFLMLKRKYRGNFYFHQYFFFDNQCLLFGIRLGPKVRCGLPSWSFLLTHRRRRIFFFHSLFTKDWSEGSRHMQTNNRWRTAAATATTTNIPKHGRRGERKRKREEESDCFWSGAQNERANERGRWNLLIQGAVVRRNHS